MQHNQNKKYVSLSDCFTSILIYCNLKNKFHNYRSGDKRFVKKKALLRNATQIFVWIFHWSALKLSAYSAGDTDTPYLDTILDTRDNNLLPRLHNTFEGLFTVRARTVKDLTWNPAMQSLSLSHNEQWHENMTVELTKSSNI